MPQSMFRTYKTDEDKVKVYTHRFIRADEEADKLKKVAKDWVERYENKPKSNQHTPKGHRVSVPSGTAIIDSLYSSMTAADIDIRVDALGTGTADQEYLASAALSKEWDICKVGERGNRAIKDALIIGVGWVKVGYEYYAEEQELPRTDEEIAADVGELIAEAQAAGSDLTNDDIAARVPVTKVEDVVLKSKVTVDYVPWDRMRWDPDAENLEDVRWYAQVIHMKPEEVRENPEFVAYCASAGTSKKLKELRGTETTVATPTLGGGVDKLDTEDDRIPVIEMHDSETGTVCTYAKGTDFLLNEQPGLFAINDELPDRSPFVPCILRGTSSRVRGVSEMELMLPTLRQLDMYHSRLATYVERFAPKIFVPKGALTKNGEKALRSQEYGAAVEYEAGAFDKPTPFEPPQLPAEVFGVPDKLEDNLRESTGVNELMRGLFPDRKRTATETAEVVTASAARQAEKRVSLERFWGEIGRRMLQLMQMFYTEEQLVRYQDYEGPIEWQWTADDIVFETKLNIALTPKETKNRQTERDEGTMLLNVLGPASTTPDPVTGAPLIDPRELYTMVLEKMGLPRRDITRVLRTAEQAQIAAMEAQQTAAAAANANAGVPRADMAPGPMDEAALAAAANEGTIPPEILAAAQGIVPGSPDAVETISEDLGQPA
jgi:hypothetical protein